MKIVTTFFLLNAFCFSICAQSVSGLWRVISVHAGDREVTPVAKWIELNEDGSYSSGNGWLQNAEGIWTYDKNTSFISLENELGIRDEFGPFTLSYKSDKMYWIRKEEGMEVIVIMEPASKLPMSPADYLSGLWELDNPNQNTTVASGEDQYYLFFRWDRIYQGRTKENEQTSGFWHIDGHSPRITMLPHAEDGQTESWEIEVDKEKLIMKGVSDSNIGQQRVYKRRREFTQ